MLPFSVKKPLPVLEAGREAFPDVPPSELPELLPEAPSALLPEEPPELLPDEAPEEPPEPSSEEPPELPPELLAEASPELLPVTSVAASEDAVDRVLDEHAGAASSATRIARERSMHLQP